MADRFNSITLVHVGICFQEESQPITVGRLAQKDKRIFFEYDAGFLQRGLEISPFHLALGAGLKTFDPQLMDGLPGVFNDSLPDGWGQLLLDRSLRAKGVEPRSFSVLDRLAHIGHFGMGALVYTPDHSEQTDQAVLDLDAFAGEIKEVFVSDSSQYFEHLLALNGSSAGARPKAMIGLDSSKKKIIEGGGLLPKGFDHWLVKFSGSSDDQNSGVVEYIYSLMAKKAGLEMPETYLFESQNGPGYFATKRFDRGQGVRYHCHSAAGLLHADFRTPSLDYKDLLKATLILTRDSREAHKIYRLAVFNILAHNRDDHGKNFSYLMDQEGKWRLAPAYDLTYSSGPGGEQSTMVLGQGKNITDAHLLELAKHADLKPKEALEIMDQVRTALTDWPKLTKEYGVKFKLL